MRTEYYFNSGGAGKIRCIRWTPAQAPRAVLQIVHGIAEHSERYHDFASYLNAYGVLVVSEDHMGHGGSIGKNGIKGYFTGGWHTAVEDTYRLMCDTMEEFPGLPYILLGHSMGSFMARTLLITHPDCGISGCILSGTGWQPEAFVKTVLPVVKGVCRMEGETKPSKFLNKVMFGGYNSRVEHPRTEYDWLTRDRRVVDAYIADPLCGFIASAGLVRDMMQGLSFIADKDNLQKMNKQLPVYFVAGGDDPVGNYGDGVHRAAEAFSAAGMESVFVRIYPLCRHEVLNEINRRDVYSDLWNWISKCINKT